MNWPVAALRTIASGVAVLIAADPVSGAQFGSQSGTEKPFTAELVAAGFDDPVLVTAPPGETERLFVAEQAGRIEVVHGGVVQPAPFLDITAKVTLAKQIGLVGFLFHPDYASNGFFYVYYTTSSNSAVLERYRVPDPPTYAVDPASATVVLGPITDVASFHLGGGMDFGTDGKLYLAIGDRRVEIAGGGGSAQLGTTLLGKVVRIEGDGGIPADNPYVSDPSVRDEIWAFGLREPHRLAADPVTGDLYVADVALNGFEEINRIPAGVPGLNFGWQVLEGSACTPSVECAGIPCPGPGFTAPVHGYDHSGSTGCCIIGGYVYRGLRIPDLQGAYLYGDWCSGRVWALHDPGGAAPVEEELTGGLDPGAGLEIEHVTSFGRDGAGELYVVDSGALPPLSAPGAGEVYRIVPRPFLSADVATLSVAAGGEQVLTLDSLGTKPFAEFLLLGSASGASPGTVVDGILLALNPADPYFEFTLGNPNSGLLTNSHGLLNGLGQASATFALPPGLGPAFAGVGVHHAFVLLDPHPGSVTHASNAVTAMLVP